MAQERLHHCKLPLYNLQSEDSLRKQGCTEQVAYEEILDISLFFTLILTFSCCSLCMGNSGDQVIYLHYFDFVNFILLQDDTNTMMKQRTIFRLIIRKILSCVWRSMRGQRSTVFVATLREIGKKCSLPLCRAQGEDCRDVQTV